MTAATRPDTVQLQQAHELDVYGKRGPVMVRGRGATLWDETGKAYIDCAAGVGVSNVGHAHPRVSAAIAQQAEKLIHCPGMFYNNVKAEYLARLTAVAPTNLQRGFLCNSGTEAVEAAIKFARITTGRTVIIAAKRGFHGRTYGAMSATFNPKYAKDCQPLTPGFQHVAYNKIEALEQTVNEQVAALILEPVQGEGGVHPADPAYIQAAAALCRRRGALLILDEVQTGFGRCGAMFACQHYQVEPDILCLAKAIGGGMPMGAVLVSQAVTAPVGRHGSTFGGNPLACAAGLAVLDILQTELSPKHIDQLGAVFQDALQADQLPQVKQLRRLGLMIGIELKTKVRPLLTALMDRGVVALPAGPKVLRLLPPLVIEQQQLIQVAGLIRSLLLS